MPNIKSANRKPENEAIDDCVIKLLINSVEFLPSKVKYPNVSPPDVLKNRIPERILNLWGRWNL